MNEIIALKKEVKKLKIDFYFLALAVLALMASFTYTLSQVDPAFDTKTQRSYEILKRLYMDMKGNKSNDVKGVIIENLDWRTIG